MEIASIIIAVVIIGFIAYKIKTSLSESNTGNTTGTVGTTSKESTKRKLPN